MRIANVSGRLTVITGVGGVDVARASGGHFAADVSGVFDQWDQFRAWATGLEPEQVDPEHQVQVQDAQLGAPSPTPRQVFAIGLNYRDHAAEAGFDLPADLPPTFTKFPTCISAPHIGVHLPSDQVDWEVELAAVIARRADRVSADRAWDHVAGLTVGQDFSERRVQMVGPVPQFSLGKSYPGFGPLGPCLVTADELADRNDLALECTVNGEQVQKGRTSQMIFSVAELIARLSAICPLLPGDVIFTGTPAGVGMARTPPRYLCPGDQLVSTIEGIGSLHNTCLPALSQPVA